MAPRQKAPIQVGQIWRHVARRLEHRARVIGVSGDQIRMEVIGHPYDQWTLDEAGLRRMYRLEPS